MDRQSFLGNARLTRAFTLVELLVVIAIIAILAAILFPAAGYQVPGGLGTQSSLACVGAGHLTASLPPAVTARCYAPDQRITSVPSRTSPTPAVERANHPHRSSQRVTR